MNKQKDFFDKFSDFLKEFESIKNYFPAIHKTGYPFIVLFILYDRFPPPFML